MSTENCEQTRVQISVPGFDEEVIATATKDLRPFEWKFALASPTYAKLLCTKVVWSQDENVITYNSSISQAPTSPISPSTSPTSPTSPTTTISATSLAKAAQHLQAFAKVFGELNNQLATRPFGPNKIRTFLDLGSSPGGFSLAVIKHNARTFIGGVGVTLPDDVAPYPQPDVQELRDRRYETRYFDLLEFVERCIEDEREPWIGLSEEVKSNESQSHSTEVEDRPTYDLVIAGAFPTGQGRQVLWRHRQQLALTQLYIAMTNLRPGGSCVLVCNTMAFFWVVDMVGFLRKVFGSVRALKGKVLHARVPSCYLICERFGERLEGSRNFSMDADVKMEERKSRVKEILVWVKERLTEAEAEAKSKESTGDQDEQDAEDKEPEGRDASSDGSETGENTSNAQLMGLLPEYPDLKTLYEGEHEVFIQLLEPLWEKQTRAMEDHMVYLRSNPRSDLGYGGTHREFITILLG